MTALSLTLPLPPRALSPNASNGRRGPFTARSMAIASYRSEVCALARATVMAVGWRTPEIAAVTVEYGLRRNRRLDDGGYRPTDLDNMVGAFKPGLDGLVDAGVLGGDGLAHLRSYAIRARRDEGPWVRVVVEAMAAPPITARRRRR